MTVRITLNQCVSCVGKMKTFDVKQNGARVTTRL